MEQNLQQKEEANRKLHEDKQQLQEELGLTTYECLFITSTVVSLMYPSPSPPATTRTFPLHTTAAR